MSPIPVSTSAPTALDDIIYYWPIPRVDDNLAVVGPGTPMGRVGTARGREDRTSADLRHFAQTLTTLGTGGDTLTANAAGGWPQYNIYCTGGVGRAVRAFEVFDMPIDVGTGDPVATGAQVPSVHRVLHLTAWIRSPTATPGIRCGGLFIPCNNITGFTWVDDAAPGANHGGFGITGDGAGQWQYASYTSAAASTLREAVALPAHNLTDWNQIEIEIINGRPGVNATMEFLFNGTSIAVRNWTGALLEPYQAGDPNQYRYVFAVCGGDAVLAAAASQWTNFTVRKGRFTRTGIEIT